MAAMRSMAIVGLVYWLGGCGGHTLTIADTIVAPGERNAELVACVDSEPVMGFVRHLRAIPVEFVADDRVIGHGTTDKEGRAAAICPLPTGPIRFVEARCRADGRTLRARAPVYAWSSRRTIIAVDIDHTIARTKTRSLVFEHDEEDESSAISGSRRTLARLARDFEIAYVTARPRFLTDKTREWLAENEYPTGPVILSPGIRQMIDRTDYKRETLRTLRRRWPNLRIGVGNSESDVKAYTENDMLAVIVSAKMKDPRSPKAVVFSHWKPVGAFFETHGPTLADPRRLEAALHDDLLLERLTRVERKE